VWPADIVWEHRDLTVSSDTGLQQYSCQVDLIGVFRVKNSAEGLHEISVKVQISFTDNFGFIDRTHVHDLRTHVGTSDFKASEPFPAQSYDYAGDALS
jgi:hypothetical protein